MEEDKREIALLARERRRKTNDALMENGITLIDPERAYIDEGVGVGAETVLYPDTYIEGKSVIGRGCVIEPNVRIVNSTIGDNVTIKMCTLIVESVIGDRAQVGPFAHLRPGTLLSEDVKIGNFVEVKKTVVKRGSKANHLAYLGDTEIGEGVNVGAGTITCNYDGVGKYKTKIGNNVFIGSDTQLVAPVSIGDDALIGAGSTITKDVPDNALAVSRVKQVNILEKGCRGRKEKRKG